MSPYTAPVADYNRTIKDYGFDDYFGVGDLIGMTRGGYNYDGITAGSAVSWMRSLAPCLEKEGKPWFFAVNLVNPHGVMFLNTDPLGSNAQEASRRIARASNEAKTRTDSASCSACQEQGLKLSERRWLLNREFMLP